MVSEHTLHKTKDEKAIETALGYLSMYITIYVESRPRIMGLFLNVPFIYFQTIDMYKEEEVEMKLANKQEAYV